MLGNSKLPKSPLYNPESKIKNFVFGEDYENIHFHLLNTGNLYTDPNCHYFLGHDKEWKRPKEICDLPHFIDGKPDRFDALQGIGSTCWLVSALEAITLNDQLFNHVVPSDQSFAHNYTGAFHFRIWQLGVWYDVLVDDLLPVYKKNKSLCYVRSRNGNVFWAALLEKAYAKISGGKGGGFDYRELAGGFPITSFQDFSGGLVERVRTRHPPPGRSVRWLINELFSKRALMGCGFSINKEPEKGLEEQHVYTVTDVYRGSDSDYEYSGLYLVRVMNPWGEKEWKGNWSDDDLKMWGKIDQNIRKKLNFLKREDGEFWMDEKDFEKYFLNLWICHLGPGQYVASFRIPEPAAWETTTFFGEWRKGVSAGGSDVSNRHINPHYKFMLKSPENDTNKDGLSFVVIELTQRSKFGRTIQPLVGFFVYPLADVDERLDKIFFVFTEPIEKDVEFFRSDGRAYVMSFTLQKGAYCIVPCTEFEGEETQFLLRVFTESRVARWEYDTKISKSLPLEDLNETLFDDGLKKQFEKVADGRGEVGWIELMQILEKTMNPNISFSGIFSSIFNYISNTVAKRLSLKHSDSDKTEYIVFSKDECRSMIAMLDDDHTGKLNYSEFCNLWRKIRFWCQVYDTYRDTKEGYMNSHNLKDALSSLGYNVNKQTVHSLVYVYANEQGHIVLTDFILCGVTLETALTLYKKMNIKNDHEIILTLEQWVKNILIV